jgi:hypothetical protein
MQATIFQLEYQYYMIKTVDFVNYFREISTDENPDILEKGDGKGRTINGRVRTDPIGKTMAVVSRKSTVCSKKRIEKRSGVAC